MSRKPTIADEMVPLAERLRFMQAFRVAAIACVLLFVLVSDEITASGAQWIWPVTGGYAAVSVLGEGLWRLARRRGLLVFGLMLLVDGAYMAWVTHTTGATASDLRYVALLHLIAATLLASYRTGLKLALWHSLLLFVTYHAAEAKILPPSGTVTDASSYHDMLAFVAVFWLVAVATACFSAINERELRRRKLDLQALAVMAHELEQAMDPVSVARTMLDNVVQAFDFRRGVVLAGRDDLSVLAITGETDALPMPATTDDIVRQVAASRTTALVRLLDPHGDPLLHRLLPGAKNVVVVPLLAEGRSVGTLALERHVGRIDRRVLAMIDQFAAHGSLALRNTWLLAEVHDLAYTDALTRIANRRTFEEALEREMSRAARSAQPVSVAILDIDHFKAVNDTHGHQTGDEVLRQVAAVLASGCKGFDVPARFGGEEFAVILPACDTAAAAGVAERFRRLVAQAPTASPITVSIGVATYPGDGIDSSSLVGAADRALYRSKQDGRNRVTVSRTLAPPSPSAATQEVDLPW